MERYSISQINITNIFKITILPNTIYGFNAILIKIFVTFFIEIRKISSNVHIEP